MAERRFFNDRERAALFLAADGCCSECGVATLRKYLTPEQRSALARLLLEGE